MKRQTIALALACLAFALRAGAQSAVDPSGHWEGTVDLPNFKLPVVVDIARSESGGLIGTLTNTSEGIQGLPLKTVSIDGRLVQFVIASGSGSQEFSGVLTADGRTISGAFNVNGFSAPIEFTRTGDAHIDRPTSPPIAKEFEGTWRGMLDVQGTQNHVLLKMTNHADGTSTGVVVNLDSGAIEVPISAITQKASSLTVQVNIVGGTLAATLSADGSELSGTWSQRGLSAPIAFKRETR
jgi:hypothetical protein